MARIYDKSMNGHLFDGKAAYYEKSRPLVSQEAVKYLYSIIPSNAVFADIGAGTGKFTSLIAERGNLIYAVEPSIEMLAILTRKLQKFTNVKVMATNAEGTMVPDHSVNVVVTVSALHWFDLNAFRSECLRILKPDGIVVAIYNSQKNELRKKTENYYCNTATDIFFKGRCETLEFPNPMLYTWDKFVAYHLSHSTAPNFGDEGYESYLSKIKTIFDDNNTDGKYLFDFVSVLYIDKEFTNNCS